MRRTILTSIALTVAMTGLIFSLVGGSLAVGGQQALRDKAAPVDGIETEARIVAYTESLTLVNGRNVPYYAPTYEYTDVNGDLHRVTDHINTDARPPAVGSIVEISYRPGDPESVRRTDIDDEWLDVMVTGGRATTGVGGAMLLVGVAIAVSGLRRRRSPRPRTVTGPFVR